MYNFVLNKIRIVPTKAISATNPIVKLLFDFHTENADNEAERKINVSLKGNDSPEFA